MKKRNIAALLVAIMSISAMLGGCSGGKEKQGENVKVTWFILGSEQRDLQLVNDKLSEMTKEKIGVDLVLKQLDASSYVQKMNMVISTKENFDLCWTSPQTNDYYANVGKNAYMPLDDLLNEYGKETRASVDEKIWDATRVNGKIYGIINNQIMATGYGFAIPKPIANESGIDYSTVTDWRDLGKYFEYIESNYPERIALGYNSLREPFSNCLPLFGFEAVGANITPGALRLGDDSYEVVNQYETEEFKEYISMMHEWYGKGYLKADAATSAEYEADVNADKFGVLFPLFMDSDSTILDAYPNKNYGNTGFPHYTKKLTPNYITTDRALATMTAISATSKNPEKAMQLIELMNTDKEVYNTLCYGIEGKHYKKVEPYTNAYGATVEIEQIEKSGYAPNTHWMFGNTENRYITTYDQAHSSWKKQNAEAEISSILGFVFDSKSVIDEIAMCSNVLDEYLRSLTSGSVAPEERYNEFIEKLKVAGCDNIVAEKQRQLNEWLKNR